MDKEDKLILLMALDEYKHKLNKLSYYVAAGRSCCEDAKSLMFDIEHLEKVMYHLGGAGMQRMRINLTSVLKVEE